MQIENRPILHWKRYYTQDKIKLKDVKYMWTYLIWSVFKLLWWWIWSCSTSNCGWLRWCTATCSSWDTVNCRLGCSTGWRSSCDNTNTTHGTGSSCDRGWMLLLLLLLLLTVGPWWRWIWPRISAIAAVRIWSSIWSTAYWWSITRQEIYRG